MANAISSMAKIAKTMTMTKKYNDKNKYNDKYNERVWDALSLFSPPGG